MRILIGVISLFVLSSACTEEETGPIWIRVSNGSDVAYDEIALHTTDGNKSYGSLAPNDTSDYRRANDGIREPIITLRIDQDTIPSIYILIDRALPPPLPPGYYTYKVDLSENSSYYTLEQIP